MSLSQNVNALKNSLGINAEMPLHEAVDRAVIELGLASEIKGLTLVDKVNACMAAAGIAPPGVQMQAMPAAVMEPVYAQAVMPQEPVLVGQVVEPFMAAYVAAPIPVAGGEIVFKFFIDDWVVACSYNGVDLMSQVDRGQCKPSTVRTQYVPGAVLTIAGWDNESGHAAALFLAVSTPMGRFKLSSDRGEQMCKVLPMGHFGPPAGWQLNAFDDSTWQAPGRNTVWDGWHQHLPASMKTFANVTGADGVWTGAQKYNYFRIYVDAGLQALEEPPARGWDAPFAKPNRLALVERDDPNRCYFKEMHTLRQGVPARLTLGGQFEGLAITKMYVGERRYGEWRYIEAAVATAEHAITVTYNRGFIDLPGEDLVFDIAFWHFQAGNVVNFVGGAQQCCGKANTYEEGDKAGRSWTLNQDGTISTRSQPHLVLGLWEHDGETHHSIHAWQPPPQPMVMPRA